MLQIKLIIPLTFTLEKEHHSMDLVRVRLAPEWQSLDVAVTAPQSLVSQMGVDMGMGSFIHWSCDSQWIGAQYKMGKTFQTGWSMRGITRSRAHYDSPDPTPLGPAGTPLVPALTHSTSGTVTGSNVRLGTSKDLSAGHETRLQRFGGDDNTPGCCWQVLRLSSLYTFVSQTSSSSTRIVGEFRRRAFFGKTFKRRPRTSFTRSMNVRRVV